MARPRKEIHEQRRNTVSIRMNDAEFHELKRMAIEAGVPYGEYARATILGKRPRARPSRDRFMDGMMYELQSIATNFGQLRDALDDEVFGKWCTYVGEELAGRLIDRDDLTPLFEEELNKGVINNAGQVLNAFARKVNTGKEVTDEECAEVIAVVKNALDPLYEAAKTPPLARDEVEPEPDGPER